MKIEGRINEKKLIRKLKNGDKEAFRCVFEQYKDIVYGYSYLLTKSDVLAEEMVQEVFMKIWDARSQLLLTGSFKSFIFTVTKYRVYNLLRKASYDENLKFFTDHLRFIRIQKINCSVLNSSSWPMKPLPSYLPKGN